MSGFSLGSGISGFGSGFSSGFGCSFGGVGMLGVGSGSSGTTGLFVVSTLVSCDSFLGSGCVCLTISLACLGAFIVSATSLSTITTSINASLSSVYFLAGSEKNVSLTKSISTIVR